MPHPCSPDSSSRSELRSRRYYPIQAQLVERAPELRAAVLSRVSLSAASAAFGLLQLASLNEDILLLAHQVLVLGPIVQFRPSCLSNRYFPEPSSLGKTPPSCQMCVGSAIGNTCALLRTSHASRAADSRAIHITCALPNRADSDKRAVTNSRGPA